MRDYLGVSVIHAFEQRRVAAAKAMQARGAVLLDMDAQEQVRAARAAGSAESFVGLRGAL